MAAITTYTKVYGQVGITQAAAVYAVYNADASDTIDLGADFDKVVTALWCPSTGSSSAGTMTISDDTVTIPASAADDAGFMLIQGSRVQSITSP